MELNAGEEPMHVYWVDQFRSFYENMRNLSHKATYIRART